MSEEVELLRRQLYLVSLAACDPPVQINLQVSGSQGPELQVGLSGELLDAPEDGLHPGREFDDAERFREVVVRSGFEAQHSIEFAGTRGQHEDRGVAGTRAHAAADFKSVDPRKPKIQDKETPRGAIHGSRETAMSVIARVDRAAQILEMERQKPCDVTLVLDDKNPTRVGAHSTLRGACVDPRTRPPQDRT